ncbi:MAG: hydrogenase 3 maturation endopeptidase HyCI [Bacillota bacterium]|nr:hydrogenase 3 maturation endopeptidase HyCI [Bacillota bacterium]
MSDWREELRQQLADGGRIAVLGAGSVLCGDDAAGMLVIDYLREQAQEDTALLLCAGSTAPENFTGEIKRFAPQHLLVVDAAYIGREPGAIQIITADAIHGAGFSTHMLPFPLMLDYLRAHLDCSVTVIGVQPRCTDFGADAGAEVTAAARLLAATILELLGKGAAKA